MGLRIVLYGLAFNILYGLSRATVGAVIAGHHGTVLGLAAALAGPLALLAIAMRLLPGLRARLVTVSVLSVAAMALLTG